MNTRKQVLVMSALLMLMLITVGIYGAWYPHRETDAEAHFEEATAERGAILFARNCRLCHGDVGEGGALAGRLTAAPALDRPTLQGFADSKGVLQSNISPTDTTLRISPMGPIKGGSLIMVDEERMEVTGTSGSEATVVRGVGHTTRAAHTANTPVLLFDEATLKETEELITNTIACGRVGTAMPAWSQQHGGPLSDEQIRQLMVLITRDYWELVDHEVDIEDTRTVLTAAADGDDKVFEVADVTVLNEKEAYRLGDERVRVTAKVPLNGKRGIVTVDRGILNSTPLEHPEGEEVFFYPEVAEPAINQASCGQTAPPPREPATPTVDTNFSGGPTITVVAQAVQFDLRTITAPPNTRIQVILDNRDAGVQHNIAFYASSTATTQPLAPGSIGTTYPGPGQDDTIFTTPAAGSYFFRCDVHPTTMTGTFTVR